MSLLQSNSTLLAAVLLAAIGADARAAELVATKALHSTSAGEVVPPTTVQRRGAWFVATSPNFQVCSLQSVDVSRETAAACEQLRSDLAAKCALTLTSWNPRCQVVLHASSATYESTVGVAGRSTLASALVKRGAHQITRRQIDVRGDVEDFLTVALPHELCHVLLADRFVEVPLWCDEGLALQFDAPEKLRLHERDLRHGLATGQALSLETLLTLRQYPAGEHWPAFYGQSASVVRCLLQRGSPRQLLQFAELQQTRGVNAALREVYGLQGTSQLAEIWQASLRVPSTIAPSLAPLDWRPAERSNLFKLAAAP